MRIRDLFSAAGARFSRSSSSRPRRTRASGSCIETVHRLKELGPSFVSVTKTGGKPAEKTIELTARHQARGRRRGDGAHDVRDRRTRRDAPHLRAHPRRRRSRTSCRSAATRPPTSRASCARPTGSATPTSSCASSASAAFRSVSAGAAYPEKHQEAPVAEADLAEPEGQGRRRRRLPHHADVLPQRRLLRVRRARARDRHHGADRRRHHADHQRRADRAHRQALGRRASPPICRPISTARAATRRRRARSASRTPSASVAGCSRGGAPGIHFYTLNQSPATSAILRELRRDSA